MADDYRLETHGLVLDPSQIAAGQAAVTESQNWVSKRDGLIETRGGFESYISDLAIAASMPNVAYMRETNASGLTAKWFVATDGVNMKAFETSNVTAAITLAGDPGYMRAEPFADRQVWTFPNALRMLDKPTTFTGAFQRLPGAPRGPAPQIQLTNPGATTTDRWLPAKGIAAYRVVIARYITTSQGTRVVYGAPSDYTVIVNPFGAVIAYSTIVTIPIGTLGAGDEIQIYRTGAVTYTTTPDDVALGDEMTMVHAYKLINAPAFATSTYAWTDRNLTDSWGGPSLYTNDTQEGIAQSNYRVRVARDVSYYNGMAFYAGGTPGMTKTIELRGIVNNYQGYPAANLDPLNTLASYPLTADTTINTKVLSNCNPTVANLVASYGLSVGQLVNITTNEPDATGGGTPIRGEVVSWSTGANTITLDTNATATSVATDFYVWDWVGIQTSGGSKQRIYPLPYSLTNNPFTTTGGVFNCRPSCTQGGVGLYVSYGGQDMERAWAAKFTTVDARQVVPRMYTAQTQTYPYMRECALRFEWDDSAFAPGDSSFMEPFEVISSKAAAFSQQLGTTYTDNLCRSEREGGYARLWVSKPGLPEAVPLPNYYDIGDVGAAISRVIATTDSLWVFKADGLWRVYGDTPETLVIQPFDPLAQSTTNGSTSSSATYDTFPWFRRVGNAVVAWTTRGVLVVDSSGARSIDMPVQSYLRGLLPGNATNPIIMSGAYSGVDLRESLVIFGCRTHTYANNGFAFGLHIESGTWFTVSTVLDYYSAAYSWFRGSGDSDTGVMYLCNQNGFSNYYDPPSQYTATLASGLPYAFSDKIYGPGSVLTVTISAVAADGVTVTLAAAQGMQGCLVSKGGQTYMAVGPVGDGLTTTLVLDRAGITTGTATIQYYPIDKMLTYGITTSGIPNYEKFFTESYIGFQNIRGGTFFTQRWQIRGESSPSSWYTEQYPEDTATALTSANGLTADRAFQNNRDIPTNQTRATGCSNTIRHKQAATYMAIDSAAIAFDPKSTRIKGRS